MVAGGSLAAAAMVIATLALAQPRGKATRPKPRPAASAGTDAPSDEKGGPPAPSVGAPPPSGSNAPNDTGPVPPPAGGDWPLRNRGLALVPGTWYQLCFDAKQRPTPVFGFADASSARMRLLSAGTAAASVDFVPTATWASVCTSSFTPWSSDNNVQFGFAGPDVATGYYVDNLRINEVACVKTSCAAVAAQHA